MMESKDKLQSVEDLVAAVLDEVLFELLKGPLDYIIYEAINESLSEVVDDLLEVCEESIIKKISTALSHTKN